MTLTTVEFCMWLKEYLQEEDLNGYDAIEDIESMLKNVFIPTNRINDSKLLVDFSNYPQYSD